MSRVVARALADAQVFDERAFARARSPDDAFVINRDVLDWGMNDEPSSTYVAESAAFAKRLAREARFATATASNEFNDDVTHERIEAFEVVGRDDVVRVRDRGREGDDGVKRENQRAPRSLRGRSARERLRERGDFIAAGTAIDDVERCASDGDDVAHSANRVVQEVERGRREAEGRYARERDARRAVEAKYEALGERARDVLRQRDDARAMLEASTTRERNSSMRIDELQKRLDEERALSEERLEEVRRTTETWRAAQVVEANAMKAAAEGMMREANEAMDRVEERIAARVGAYETRLSEAEREAAKRARDAVGRFGALASATEVQAAREVNALTKRVKELEEELNVERRERSTARFAAESAKRDVEETRGQFDSFRNELALARDVVRARDEALDTVRRELRQATALGDEYRARSTRLENEKRELEQKVSSLEDVLGDVGGFKRNALLLRSRVAQLTSGIQQAKEANAEIKREFMYQIAALKVESIESIEIAVAQTRGHYEARLRAAGEGRVPELLGSIAELKGEIDELKRDRANAVESAVASERASIANASEASIRASTQRTIQAEKAKALADVAARESQERLEASMRDREAIELALMAANEHIAALKGERAGEEQKRQLLVAELKEARANARDLSKLFDARGKANSNEDHGDDDKDGRMREDMASIKSALESANRDLVDAKAETVAAVKRANDNARLEIEALRRGLEMATEKQASEHEARVANLEQELAVALESKRELREQLERYEALTALQDDAMTASKSQLKSLNARLRSLETSVSGSPMSSSPGSGPPPSPSSLSRSFFRTPKSDPSSPSRRPAPTPMTAPRSSSPMYSPIKPKSPLFKDLE